MSNATKFRDADKSLREILEKHGVAYPPCDALCGIGWHGIIDTLIADLIQLGWDRDLQQIKEKFGGLRFYIGAEDDEIRARIRHAESDAWVTCEECGRPGGQRRVGYWLKTECQACHDERVMAAGMRG